MRILWLPSVLRAAGLTVHEVSGWRTRGASTFGPVRGITCHHTAGSRNSTVQGEINVLINGSTSAPGPIAQLLLARNGDWHVVASGTCYHNKIGWGGPNEGYGNDALLGIEAQHSGGDEPWTKIQYDSYVRGVAALVRHRADGWSPTVARVAGHKEHQPGAKSDPTFSMNIFRGRVAAEIDRMNRPPALPKEPEVTEAELIAAVRKALAFEAPAGSTRSESSSFNHVLHLLLTRTNYIGNEALRDIIQSLADLATATASLRAFVEAGEAADVADLATVLERLQATESRLADAIAQQEQLP